MSTEPLEPTPAGLDVGALFDAHGAFVHRVAQRLTGSSALADDVLQEVFLLVHRRRDEIDARVGIRTWLYRTTVNVTRQRRRSDRRYDDAMTGLARVAEQAAPSPDAAAERKRKGTLIRACLARMTETQREVFVLFELEELDGAEIAAILDLPVNTVWSRLRLAREAFRAAWRDATERA